MSIIRTRNLNNKTHKTKPREFYISIFNYGSSYLNQIKYAFWAIILSALSILLTGLTLESRVWAASSGDVVINEIMYNPISGQDGDEFLELYNTTANPIDLSGWCFTNGINLCFGPGTSISANGLNYVPGSASVVGGTAGQLVNGIDPSVNGSIEPTILGNTLTWNITGVTVGTDLPTITYQAQQDIDYPTGNFTNVVTASEPSGAEMDINSTVGDRSSTWTVKLQNSEGYDVIKLLTTPADALKETDQPFSFDLTYANTSDDIDIDDLQFIEVLPYNNDGPRDPESNFHGTLEFSSITSSLPGDTYMYTNAAPNTINLDPCHNTNIEPGDPVPAACAEGAVDSNGNATTATGETDWYDCSGGFSTGACPITEAEVTGIKMAISGSAILPAGSNRQKFTITMQPTGNQKDDIYTNNFGSRINTNSLAAISNDVSVKVVASSVGDKVWLDLNGNGAQDANEPGIPGVKLELYDAADNLLGTTTTDANGSYSFEDLSSGDYHVTVDASTLPPSLTQAYDLDGLGSPNRIDGSIGANTNVVTWDFGYRTANTKIGDTIWLDTNENGIQDASEAGIPNLPVVVTYYGSDGQSGGGDDITFNLVTDTNGKYLLEGIPYGDYSVKVNIDNTYKNTYDLDGNKDSLTMLSISANSPESLNGDFGYAKKTSAEQIVTNITESITSIANKLANTGQNTKLIIVGSVILIIGGAYVMIKKRK